MRIGGRRNRKTRASVIAEATERIRREKIGSDGPRKNTWSLFTGLTIGMMLLASFHVSANLLFKEQFLGIDEHGVYGIIPTIGLTVVLINWWNTYGKPVGMERLEGPVKVLGTVIHKKECHIILERKDGSTVHTVMSIYDPDVRVGWCYNTKHTRGSTYFIPAQDGRW